MKLKDLKKIIDETLDEFPESAEQDVVYSYAGGKFAKSEDACYCVSVIDGKSFRIW